MSFGGYFPTGSKISAFWEYLIETQQTAFSSGRNSTKLNPKATPYFHKSLHVNHLHNQTLAFGFNSLKIRFIDLPRVVVVLLFSTESDCDSEMEIRSH